jgi:DNA repair protein RecO
LQKRDLAIVLRAIPFQERHRIVTAITEQHGQVTAMAKNAIQSRRFGGSLEPFTASEWLFTEKPGAEMLLLSEAHVRRGYEGLRKDFERLSLASAFSEFLARLAPRHAPCPELFRIHGNALAAVEEAGPSLALLNGYLGKLLQWNGTQPQLMACLGCERELETLDEGLSVSCVVADAGFVCPECRATETRHVREREQEGFDARHLRVSLRALRDFHAALSVPIRQAAAEARASRGEQLDLFRFIEALFTYHLPGFDRVPLKSLRFLDLGPEPGAQWPPAIA